MHNVFTPYATLLVSRNVNALNLYNLFFVSFDMIGHIVSKVDEHTISSKLNLNLKVLYFKRLYRVKKKYNWLFLSIAIICMHRYNKLLYFNF